MSEPYRPSRRRLAPRTPVYKPPSSTTPTHDDESGPMLGVDEPDATAMAQRILHGDSKGEAVVHDDRVQRRP
jgi:hypothetical protein